jgi:hypothetical protein
VRFSRNEAARRRGRAIDFIHSWTIGPYRVDAIGIEREDGLVQSATQAHPIPRRAIRPLP